MPKEMRILIPITKVDEAKRLVYGVMSQEILDKSGEIMDYATGKPAFLKWSEDLFEASKGKSYGNVREMHGMNAAGLLSQPLAFNDDEKTVECCAKVIDDQAWMKVSSGVYTGFSIGGAYKARWQDPENPEVTRYTPEPCEVSLVDNPCVPSATFNVIKADGSSELRKFQSPTGDTMDPKHADAAATIAQPEQVWKATDGSTHATKKEALAKNEALATDAAASEITGAADEAIASLEDVLKAAGVKKDDDMESAAKVGGALDDGASGDAKVDVVAKEDIAPGQKPKTKGDQDGAEDIDENADNDKKPVKKSIWDVSQAARLLGDIDGFQGCVAFSAAVNGTDPALGSKLKEAVIVMADFLTQLVASETAAIVAKGDEAGALLKGMRNPLALSKAILKLSDEQLPEADRTKAADLAKAGARNSTKDKEIMKNAFGHADAIRKCMKDMGHVPEGEEGDDEGAAKASSGDLAKANALNDALTKKYDGLAGKVATLTKTVQELLAQPVPPKGQLRVVKKGNGATDPVEAPVDVEFEHLIKTGASPERVQAYVMNKALQTGVAVAQ